jgi:hypothetical protein
MSSVRNGVQWTSLPQDPDTRSGNHSAIGPRRFAHTPAVAATDYLLMSRSALLARPVSGTAWNNMREAAQHPAPRTCATPTTDTTWGRSRLRSSMRGRASRPSAPRLEPA